MSAATETSARPAARGPSLQAWRAAGEWFEFSGRRIFFRQSGPGAGAHGRAREAAPCIVLVHGFPTASWDWHALWEPLALRFRLIAPDLLGFGFSAKPRAWRYTIGEQAGLVEALLAELGVSEVHVLAHDYGDTVAQELLARFEARDPARPRLTLRSVCLLNGGVFPEAQRPLPIQKLLAGPLGPVLTPLLTRGRVLASLSSVFAPATRPSADMLEAFWTLISQEDGLAIAHRLLAYLRERRRYRARWVGALQEARAPLCFIAGALDPVSGAPMAARFRELVPEAEVVELEAVGHYPQLEAPAAVLDIYSRFLAARAVSGDA